METKVYRDFNEFKELNRDLLKLLAISDEHAKGIWDARQAEIAQLTAQITQVKDQLKAVKDSLVQQAAQFANELQMSAEQTAAVEAEKAVIAEGLAACQAKLKHLQGEQAKQDALVQEASGQIDQVLAENQHLRDDIAQLNEEKRHLEFSLQPLELYGEKMRRDLGEYAQQVADLEAALGREKKYGLDLKTYVDNFKDNAQALKKVTIQAQQERDEILAQNQHLQATIKQLKIQLEQQQEEVQKAVRQKEEYVQAFREEKRQRNAQAQIMEHERQQKITLTKNLQELQATLKQHQLQQNQWATEKASLQILITKLEAEKNQLKEERQIAESNLAKVKNSLRVISEV